MPGIKLQKFLGKAPRIAPELLPNEAAQVAENVKLYSGDLIPYPAPVISGNHGLTGVTPVTLHALRNPSTNDPVWLVWDKDVDIATPAGTDNVSEQRFYYTGDGAPKVSTYALATTGAQPYPVDYYDLGLPLPTQTPTATAPAFARLGVHEYTRTADGITTITTGAAPLVISGLSPGSPTTITTATAHGLTTGNTVIIRGNEAAPAINGRAVAATVTGANTFTIPLTTTSVSGGGGFVYRPGAVNHNLRSGALVTLSSFTTFYGTYTMNGTTTVVVDCAGHGLTVGARLAFTVTSGTFPSGVYTITSVPTADQFLLTASTALVTSGILRVDVSSLNATSVEITVTNATTFTFTNPGFAVGPSQLLGGNIDLAGPNTARNYLYTWFTPWEEESIGSDPSTELFLKEGQVVTVANLPTAPPAGKNFIRGIRLYRTVATPAASDYLRLATLWFPVTVSNVTGTTVTTAQPHNLSVGSVFKISTGVVGGTVATIVSDFIFTYTGGTGSGGTGGTLYHDVSENPGTTTPRYWGDGSFSFTDDFRVSALLNVLTTDDYTPPPAGLKGLIEYNNNMLVGFVGNEVYFSELSQYHAWPRAYKREVPYPIVGLATYAGYLLVLTDTYPYVATGTDPAIISLTRIDARYPCLNKRSIASMNFGVMYSTHDGLALYSTATGPQLITRLLYNSDTWNADLDPSTLLGSAYKDAYLAWHSTGGISYERDDRVGGYFVDLVAPITPTADWYDPITNKLYYTAGTVGDVYTWDDLTHAPQPFTWKSKIITTANPINIGAAQVDAAYAVGPTISPVWETASAYWDDYTLVWGVVTGVMFKLWVDKQLVYSQVIDTKQPFRLPTGYKSDTFEVGVEAAIRVREIRMAETPLGLREV